MRTFWSLLCSARPFFLNPLCVFVLLAQYDHYNSFCSPELRGSGQSAHLAALKACGLYWKHSSSAPAASLAFAFPRWGLSHTLAAPVLSAPVIRKMAKLLFSLPRLPCWDRFHSPPPQLTEANVENYNQPCSTQHHLPFPFLFFWFLSFSKSSL